MSDFDWDSTAVMFLLRDDGYRQFILMRRSHKHNLSRGWVVQEWTHEHETFARLKRRQLSHGLAEHYESLWWRPLVSPFGYAENEDDSVYFCESREDALALWRTWLEQEASA